MVTIFYHVEDPYSPDFTEAMGDLYAETECYIEIVNLFTVMVECDEEDVTTVGEYFMPFI